MVKIILDQIFFMSNDVETSFKIFWNTFLRIVWQLFKVKFSFQYQACFFCLWISIRYETTTNIDTYPHFICIDTFISG